MGSILEKLYVKTEEKKTAEIFTNAFNRYAGNDPWMKKHLISIEDFFGEKGYFRLNIESEPIFSNIDDYKNLEDIVFECVSKTPDDNLVVEFERGFSNCGDTLLVLYKYNSREKELTVISRYSDLPSLDYCPECDFEDEESFYVPLDKWMPDTVYTCPECGAVLDWDVSMFEDSYSLDAINQYLNKKES